VSDDLAAGLREALTQAATELAGVELVRTTGGTEFRVAGRIFAVVHDATAEFDLDPVVARAARGTPSTEPSSRGVDWVAFTPPELDRFSRDRAVAWLGSAHRRAEARA
jgi:hypothetical protein